MPPRPLDLVGVRFSRLTVVERAPNHGRLSAWVCRCDCGEVTVVTQCHLRAGHTRSCGCLHREITTERSTIHGHRPKKPGQSKTYLAWRNAKTRCFNPKCKRYEDYGGRGITMSAAWRLSFAQFLADMGECPPGLTLERIDNDGHYERGNCAWVTRKVQANNRRPRRQKVDSEKPRAVASAP